MGAGTSIQCDASRGRHLRPLRRHLQPSPGRCGRAASYTLAGTAVLLDYDDASRLVAANSDTFGYDSLDRLTGYAGAVNQSFSYDAVGNRTAFTENSASDSYAISTTGNRLLSVSGTNNRSYSYAANGAITGDGIHTYSYDPRGRLTGVDGTVSYTFNGVGERIRKTVSGTSTLFVYDEQGQLIGEYDDTGTAVTETVYLDTQPVGVLKGSTIYYVHTDQLNTPRVITDDTGTIVWRWDSDPFGTNAANEDPDQDTVTFAYHLRFPGQYHDSETGLHYNYFRDYDPVTGRYMQSDPIGLAGGLNAYAYVDGDPTNWIDPYGLFGIADLPVIPQPAVDAAAGFGDALSFGLTDWIRDQMGTNSVVDKCSGVYSGGKYAGYGWLAGTGVGATGRALQIEFNVLSKGNVFKIISKRLKAGFRIDPAHHGKPWGHTHTWGW